MGTKTNIEWCDHTFNAWRGCAKVPGHPACDHCYAEALAKRNPSVLGTWGGDSEDGESRGVRVVAAPDYWKLPAKWDRLAAAEGKRRTVFALSQGDVCEEWNGRVHSAEKGAAVLWARNGIGVLRASYNERKPPNGARLATLDDVRAQLAKTIDATPNLIWLLLTKRPERIASCFGSQPRPNVMWGTSVSDQATLDRFAGQLARMLGPPFGILPAGRFFLSIEPLLGPVRLQPLVDSACKPAWVIVGGESGPHARPMQLVWVRALRDECAELGIPFFFKQWGEWWPHPGRLGFDRLGKKKAGNVLDGRTHLEFPAWFDAPMENRLVTAP
jgi:protein gp37